MTDTDALVARLRTYVECGGQIYDETASAAADIPATAVAVLRERARQTENVSSAAFAPTSPDLLRAVADLMQRCVQPMWQVSRQGNEIMVGGVKFSGTRCIMCGSFGPVGAPIHHASDCPLAALERLIEGERDADR